VSEWSFQRKLITGVIVICLLAILTSGASVFASRILIANMTRVSAEEGQDLSDARALQLIGAKNIADVRACILTGGGEYAPAVRAGSSLVRDLVARLQTRTTDPGRISEGILIAERAHQILAAQLNVSAFPEIFHGLSAAAGLCAARNDRLNRAGSARRGG
jgi:CHASE3 domain sensor protein